MLTDFTHVICFALSNTLVINNDDDDGDDGDDSDDDKQSWPTSTLSTSAKIQ